MKLKIYTFPDLVLKQKAAPVPRVEKSYFKLADDMLETMYDAPGIGLAANQVGVLERIIVVDTDYELEEDELLEEGPSGEGSSSRIITHRNPKILINPEIIYKEGEASTAEGCLSVPEFRAEVPRADKIKIQYKTIDGITATLDADGLLSICLQHEMDHLDGRLFIDRISPLKREMVQKKLLKARAEAEKGKKPKDSL
jgi:peptide deformylase